MRMVLTNPLASVFVPDGLPLSEALERCTHLGIGAHQDDLEFMAYHGIAECYASKTKWFGGVVCTDGGGSARTGEYANFSDEQIRDVRRCEQEAAASMGRYGVVLQLMHSSNVVKQASARELTNDIFAVLEKARPQVVYAHNPADKHETHVAVVMATLAAIRRTAPDQRPEKVYGCEVWRDLDWMNDGDKTALDVSENEPLAAALNGVFKSQIAGGKRYDLAVMGRRSANATFFLSHATDRAKMLSFAMDLTPLALDDTLDVAAYVGGFIDSFRSDVVEKLRRQRRD